MRLVRSPAQLRVLMARVRRRHRTIGFVPTMGALHEGHLSLIRDSAARYGATVVSVFVNPLQFGPREDFRRYPRSLARDAQLARATGADVVFAPAVEQMYPEGFQTRVQAGPLSARWEGPCRPGHFDGVATVVLKLFNVVQPTHALFGQKDYQQALIIRRLVQDLDVPVMVRVLPTVREPDGLAMSSRNRDLTPAQRRAAVCLYRALCLGRARLRRGERRAAALAAPMRGLLEAQADVRVDYVAAVDAGTLAPARRLRGRVALLIAARVGDVRLIDNFLVEV